MRKGGFIVDMCILLYMWSVHYQYITKITQLKNYSNYLTMVTGLYFFLELFMLIEVTPRKTIHKCNCVVFSQSFGLMAAQKNQFEDVMSQGNCDEHFLIFSID